MCSGEYCFTARLLVSTLQRVDRREYPPWRSFIPDGEDGSIVGPGFRWMATVACPHAGFPSHPASRVVYVLAHAASGKVGRIIEHPGPMSSGIGPIGRSSGGSV